MSDHESSLPFRRRALRVLLLGADPFAAMIAQELAARPELNIRILGVIEEDGIDLPGELSRHPRLGPLAQISRIVEDLRPDRILVALADRRGRLPALELIEHQLRGVEVQEAAEMYEHLSGKLAIETLQAGSQLFREHFRCSPFADSLARALSFACALLGLVALAPVMALIALAIKLTSPGPVLFVQKRIGLGGRPFALLKFRTMTVEKEGTSEWAADNHKRVTAVGNVLRRLRIDELPQFVNLLVGDMNLVGPRPHPLSNFALFSERIPYYSLRCLVRPGLTGWAQIRYRYANNLAEETEKMRYDLYYIKHRSIWLDLQIIPATLMAVIAGHGTTADEAQPSAQKPVSLSLVPAQSGQRGLDWVPGAGVLKWAAGGVAGAGVRAVGGARLVVDAGARVVADAGARVLDAGARAVDAGGRVVDAGARALDSGVRAAAGPRISLVTDR